MVRNRIKRVVREWFRHARCEWQGNVDLVVIARRDAALLESHEMGKMLSEQFEAAVRGTAKREAR